MRKIQFLLIAIFLFLSSSIMAKESSNYTGYIRLEDQQIYFVNSSDHKKYLLRSNVNNIARDLSKLDHNDQLSFVGDLIAQNTLLVKAINYVGLQKILGVWQSSDWQLFNFRDFESLSTIAAYNDLSLNTWDQFHYSLSPGLGPQWTIFIVNKDTLNLGHLKIGYNRMELEVIDPGNGKTKEVITFHKISP